MQADFGFKMILVHGAEAHLVAAKLAVFFHIFLRLFYFPIDAHLLYLPCINQAATPPISVLLRSRPAPC
jgi:hypothetical protein